MTRTQPIPRGYRRLFAGAAGLAAAILLSTATPALADDAAKSEKVVTRGAERSAPVTPFVFEGDLRKLPPPHRWQPGDPVREVPRRSYPRPGSTMPRDYETGPDLLLDRQLQAESYGPEAFTDISRNFPGAGYSGVNPPDTNGEAGPNHYIQTINDGSGTIVTIFDKALPTPNEVASFMLDSLGTGVCANGHGDPIVLWDRYAERWMLTEFSSSGNNLCFYISQTDDPVTGGWHFYGFTAPSFPDYPKYGVWPTDANGGQGSYIVTSNETTSAAYAMDRGPMLVGDPATFQRVTFEDLSGFNFQTLTPADPDGPNAPPTGDPAIVMRQRDTENHGGPVAPGDLLEMWSWDVDWENEANSVLTEETAIDVEEFDSDLCGLTAFFCFPQPGTSTTLDPLREVIMWRLQYINHDDYETLVGNFVTDLDGNDHGGIRWFELRRPGTGAWSLFQEGTYSIDTDHRFMAASAMDQSGNIAMGYNVTSDLTFPSLRYTGRMAGDPLGVMTQAETSIHAGTASNSSNRYGDYSAMSLDPEDDCTFWFTGMDNTSSNWRTQIASFRFDACGCELFPDPLSPTAVNAGDNRIDIDWQDSELVTVEEYLVKRSRTTGGPYETIAVVPDSTPGVPNGPGYVYSDTTVSGGLTYYYTVSASDGAACKSALDNETSATATGACLLEPLFGGLESVTTPLFGVCTLDLFWSAADGECSTDVTYNIYRSTTEGFTPGPGNQIASDVDNVTYTDVNNLVDRNLYYYVVRAVDNSNGVEESNQVEVSGMPLGQVSTGTWTDDAGDTGLAQMTPGAPWHIDETEGNLGPRVYKTGDYGNSTCAELTTPEMGIGAASTITFWTKYEFENSYDKGELQISIDGGATFERVPMTYPGTSTSSSDACGLGTGEFFTGTNLDWTMHTADLSPWAFELGILRFQIGSDGSQSRQGWWIDDITITEVGVPGVCATGSSCADNPFVNVQPDGPMTVCEYDSPNLVAEVNSGTPPFSYQWYMDGELIPGATGSTFRPSELGTHRYNVKVKADSCDDDVSDGLDTQVTLVNTPYFNGLTGVSDPQFDTCSTTITWDAGSTVCDGPLQYQVYRDTSPAVIPTAENLVASGLGGTSWIDSSDLVEGNTYHYLVRAIDRSTGTTDSNTVVGSSTPTGPGTGVYAIFADDFENASTWADWTVTEGPGPHTCGEFVRSTSTSQRPSGGSGNYALALSQGCTSILPLTSTILDSPLIDLGISGIASVTLEYDIYYNHGNGDDATVEVWDGSSWVVLWADSDVDYNTHEIFDVTAYASGNANFQIRFNYQNANNDMWYSVDNVEVVVDIYNPCSTTAGPIPAPDGSLATTPLHADRMTASGDTIDVNWDASTCTASAYNLIYGNLADVAFYGLGGSACSIGTGGSYTWNGVPAGDLYFLVIGADGSGLESSWGTDGLGVERNGMGSSGECSVTEKIITATCP